ncbi:modifier of mdg4-like [Diorhabda sublineata]|uniref:modifier of mdg4-like n=1 Tax=Diorhabda sublineata TaxID=1163346 RepID=UPI0024E0BE66|nr:modifier of mdg4-like [Diorhabda sublineata]
MANAQQYCLRWNNHRSNLLTVFDELLQNEAFTDVTLACEGGTPIKCHRMVLAACSPYFQNLFIGLPCTHPVVVLKDVKHMEIKAILEYMYRGEVNVAQNQLAALLKVAETLKVKGLVEENKSNPNPKEDEPIDHSPSISTSSSVMQNIVHSSSNSSPPHSTNTMYKNPYNFYNNKPQDSRLNLPMWAMPGIPLPPHTSPQVSSNNHHSPATMLSGCYESASSDMSPLKKKKMSSLLIQRDTPILRTVLGQGQADSSQPVSLVCHPDSAEQSNSNEERIKHMKNEPLEDAQSPYTDFIPMHEEEEKLKMAIPSSSPQSYSHEMRGVTGIATYVPTQKPEWKRYKQYTRNDIMSAIEAVRNGMSALQAARKYGVPSRTLYDKVKKLGITTSRPFKRGSNGSSACFSYNTGSPYSGHLSESDENPMHNNNNSALLEASTFLQHALDGRGGDEREALAAMAAAAAHAVASGHSTSPNNLGKARSPSPSPTMLKYMRHVSLTPSPAAGSEHHNSHSETNGSSEREQEDEDQVEDLSINRKEHRERESTGVIMPPMNQVAAIVKKEELLVENLKEESRREVTLDCEGE